MPPPGVPENQSPPLKTPPEPVSIRGPSRLQLPLPPYLTARITSANYVRDNTNYGPTRAYNFDCRPTGQSTGQSVQWGAIPTALKNAINIAIRAERIACSDLIRFRCSFQAIATTAAGRPKDTSAATAVQTMRCAPADATRKCHGQDSPPQSTRLARASMRDLFRSSYWRPRVPAPLRPARRWATLSTRVPRFQVVAARAATNPKTRDSPPITGPRWLNVRGAAAR